MTLVALAGAAAGCAADGRSSILEDQSERVFDTSVLHEIRIEVAPEHIPSLEYDHDVRIPCTFTFDGVTLARVAIRQKGSGTQSGSLYTKPSFSIRFDEFVPNQTLHGLDKLILDNAMMDPTLVHEHLGFDLYQRAGIPSRRTAHAVVTLAGMRGGDVTYGVYVMVEAVNDALMARLFGEAHDHGNLYEDEDDAGDFAEDPLALDLKDADEPGRSRQRLIAFSDFLSTASDDELAARLDEFIDLERALDSFALDLLMSHGDGFWLAAHNYYLYEHPAEGRFVLLPHGMDLAFEPNSHTCGGVPVPDTLPTALGERISEHPALRARLEAAIADMLQRVWDVDFMEERIDVLGRLLAASGHDEPAFAAEVAAHVQSRDALKTLLRTTEQAWGAASAATCGDDVRSGRELCASMCDDGNLVDGDGCSASCLVEYCGDWKTQPGLGEVCDDDRSCSWDCGAVVVCGDGLVDGGELCDDGNRIDDDRCTNGCTPHCTREIREAELFLFCPVATTFESTRDICGSQRAVPAVPRSADEQAWFVERTQALAAEPWWLGISSYAGAWWAADGLPITWFGWGAGQPDEAAAGACALLDPATGAWDDRPCHEEHAVVCRLF